MALAYPTIGQLSICRCRWSYAYGIHSEAFTVHDEVVPCHGDASLSVSESYQASLIDLALTQSVCAAHSSRLSISDALASLLTSLADINELANSD